MTEQIEHPSAELQEAVFAEALDVIDQALAKMFQRELISSGEVADVLLDVRTALTTTSIVSVSAEPQASTPA